MYRYTQFLYSTRSFYCDKKLNCVSLFSFTVKVDREKQLVCLEEEIQVKFMEIFFDVC
jgi:hypothetical protein